MSIRRHRKYNGFTLIEIIVTIAILAIVCTATFSMFSYNTNVFQGSTSQFNVQSSARIAMDNITKDTKYATELTITTVNTCKNDITNKTAYDNKNYNYIYVENGSIKQAIYSNSQYTTKTILSSISSNGTNFTRIDGTTLGINIVCNDGKKTFTLNSNVVLSNFVLLASTPTIIVTPDTTNFAIRYITTEQVAVTTTPYTDLANFEKNMFSIVGPSAGITFGTNNVLNPQGSSSILMQGKDLTLNGLGNNISGNIAIKADTLNLGSGQTGTASGGEAVFDVNKLTGSLASYNSNFYLNHNILLPKPQGANNWSAIESYRGKLWSYLFANVGDSSTVYMTVRTLKNNIDFTDKSINPTVDISKIHYITGTSPNIITDNKLPNYKGVMSSVANVNSGSYEYIICHGPLTINTTDRNNGKFNFTGIIYCDDVVTFNDMGSDTFSGIIISKGLKALNVIGSQTHNWNISYNNNSNNLSEINGIINNITTSSP